MDNAYLDLIIPAGADNPEQIAATLNANIAPYLDILFNRTEIQIPTLPAQFRADLEALDDDIKFGDITRHFRIDRARKQITARTDAANHLLIFIHTIKDEAAVKRYILAAGRAANWIE